MLFESREPALSSARRRIDRISTQPPSYNHDLVSRQTQGDGDVSLGSLYHIDLTQTSTDSRDQERKGPTRKTRSAAN